MNAHAASAYRRVLMEKRFDLLRSVAHLEEDLHWIAEQREPELEEQAQDDRMARLLSGLDVRGKTELDSIERALARIEANRYGECAGCGGTIPERRLAALPTTLYCRDCAERVERGEPIDMESALPPPRSGAVPPDYSLLTGRELEQAIWEHIREDSRVDTDELRVVCRHGVVYLDGAVPSEGERQILSRIVTDVMGLTEVVDRLQVKEILWSREDRSAEPGPTDRRPWDDTVGTDDVVAAQEDGTDYAAPDGPEPDES